MKTSIILEQGFHKKYDLFFNQLKKKNLLGEFWSKFLLKEHICTQILFRVYWNAYIKSCTEMRKIKFF